MASERVQRQIDRLLDQAEEAMGQMNWDSVRDCAQAVLGLDSENADALAFLDSADRVLRNQPGGTGILSCYSGSHATAGLGLYEPRHLRQLPSQ